MQHMTDRTTRPPISTGSLFKTSEGLLVTVLGGFVGTILQGDFEPPVQIAAIATLGVSVSVYAVAAAWRKR